MAGIAHFHPLNIVVLENIVGCFHGFELLWVASFVWVKPGSGLSEEDISIMSVSALTGHTSVIEANKSDFRIFPIFGN